MAADVTVIQHEECSDENLHNKPGFAIMLLLLESEQRFRQRA
jgi:hypothetical protein